MLIMPFLLLVLEAIFLITLKFVNLPETVNSVVSHTLVVLVIATLGWLAWSIARKFCLRFVKKIGLKEKADASHLSLLTQVLFLYRLFVFGIFVITAATILMTFPHIKNVGLGILGSAGIAGIALGIAARPILLNLMAGFQIAATKTIKIGDTLLIEGETARVESIHLTHIIFRTWDARRIIVPISRFIDQPFENWDVTDSHLLAPVLLYCDYQVPLEAVRTRVAQLLEKCPYWNGRTWRVDVTNCSQQAVELRISASVNHATDAFELRAYLREKLIDFLQQEHPHALPCVRNKQV